MIRSCLHVLVVTVLLPQIGFAQTRSDAPTPEELLRGVENARLNIPASRLTLSTEYAHGRYELTAEFDGPNRRFWIRSKNRNRERMVLSGTSVTHFNGTDSVTIRSVDDQNPSLFFDPRLLGITTTYWWNETLKGELPYHDGTEMQTVGAEEINGRSCWHVSIIDVHDQRRDLWIDDENGYRVYRSEFSIPGFKRNSTTPIYSGDTESLPTRVITEYFDARGLPKTHRRIVTVLDTEPNVEFADVTWGYESLELPIGVPVADLRAKRRLGYWDGSGLALNPPAVAK